MRFGVRFQPTEVVCPGCGMIADPVHNIEDYRHLLYGPLFGCRDDRRDRRDRRPLAGGDHE